MAAKDETEKTAEAGKAQEGSPAKRRGRRESRQTTMRKLLCAVEDQLISNPKGTVGDYLRLLQMEQESEQMPTEVTVRWVESDESSASETSSTGRSRRNEDSTN